MNKIKLQDYDITPERGFLAPYNMDEVALPQIFDAVLHAARHLSDYMCAGRVRHFLDNLPEVDMKGALGSLDDSQRRKLMVHYSFIVQAYVWGAPVVPKHLPRNLAVPYCDLAEAIGQFPLLPYTAYTLDNWALLDKAGDVTLDNIYVIQNFLDGMDENWFIMIHIEIEAKAGKALAAIPDLLDAVEKKDHENAAKGLRQICDALEKCNAVFARMPEQCDPYTYYLRVRPYIHGWKDNPALPDGLVYEGVDKFKGKGQAFRGQTGSQSSIVPSMDALLGIEHEQDEFRRYLDELHHYRPPRHRAFIETVKERSNVRTFVKGSCDPNLKALYNSCLEQVYKFRTQHLEYAASYINKQAISGTGNPIDVGTGGTPFMRYLKKHRDESHRHMLPVDQSKCA